MPSLSELVAGIRSDVASDDGWVVGGVVRDVLLGRETNDWDVIVPDDPAGAARRFAASRGGAAFSLSDRHGAWRVVQAGRTVDFTLVAGTLDEDLRRRDFTINAVAVSLADGVVHDPLGGVSDITQRVVRRASDAVFQDDPLRLLRLVRLAVDLDMTIEPATATLAKRDAPLATRAAGERQYAELHRLLNAPDAVNALLLADRLGLLAAVLPEVASLRGVEQNRYHHLDVFAHTLHVIDATGDIAAHPEHYLPQSADAVRAALDHKLDGTTTVRGALRWAALLHDIAKPQTRHLTPEGAVKFFGHEQVGAAMIPAILGRFNASAALVRFCDVLVGHHLALGFLVKHQPLDARSAYRYAIRTRPYPLASIVLSLGDRLATLGDLTRLRGLRRHQRLAQEMAEMVVALGPIPPRLVLPADQLAARIGLAPGPRLGALVAAVREEQAAGTVRDADDAVRFAAAFIAAETSP
jgi:putative nucleotidyltransferase with HDIG domain